MAYLNTIGCGEGLSSSRPPLFDGTNFATWKTRFRIYARSQGVKVWMAIEDGVVVPTKIIDDVTIEKKVSEYTHEEENMMNIAAKAEMVLTSALAEKEYKRVNNCKSAQEMWNKLVITYEGTTDIKDSRMDTLIQEYENFKLQEGENIIDMETRFTRIVDELSQLGKSYTRNEKNRRVLKSLPPSWKVKVTTIKEMHNLNEYSIDNLFGNLRAYEEDNVPDKVLPKVEDKKKNMALKAILIDEDENDEELNEELQNLDESEIALLTRQLRRVLQSKAQRYGKGFLKTNNQNRVFNSNGRPNYSQNYTPNYKSNFPNTSYNKGKGVQNTNTYNNANNSNNNPTYTPPKQKEQNQEETKDVCFECKQPGHFKRECPKLQKGRILVAENGWDLSEDEDAPEASEEVVNLCLMATGDESTSTEVSTTNQEVSSASNFSFNAFQLNESNLNLVDMPKADLVELVVGIHSRYKDLDKRLHLLWSEKMKLEEMHHNQSKEFTRMMDSKVQYENEISSLNEQNHLLKVEYNKQKENILKLEVENVSLITHAEELNYLETEALKLKEENTKLKSQVVDQENFLNNKIDSLNKEKENLEIVVQRFTKGNNILNMMVHSKTSFNREGLGYDKNVQPKKVVHTKQPTKFVAPTQPLLKCSYCNKDGHTVLYCKFKNGEIKGKHVWVRKGSKPYKRVEQSIPSNKVVNNNRRQPNPYYFQQPFMGQNGNMSYHTSRNQQNANHAFYPRNNAYYTNDRNMMHRGGNYQGYASTRNTRYYDNATYHRGTQYNASRNLYMPNDNYAMPRFHHANSNVIYDVLTPGPSRQRGTYLYN